MSEDGWWDGTPDGSLPRAAMADLRLLYRLRHPGRSEPGPLALARTAASSLGWWQLVLHRAAHLAQQRRRTGGSVLRLRVMALVRAPAVLLMKFLTNNELLEFSAFESGVCLSDRGGIVLGARRIGAGTIIHHNVTIGMNLASGGVPDIGRRTWIGHDSVVHGEITLGDGVAILPGSVLTKSVPSRVLVGGNPARVLCRDFDNGELCASLRTDPEPRVPVSRPALMPREMARVE